jgi:extracellular factor (EF) 3-hydroxypalmitic acid methyl ester biosynthesis protein
MQQVLKFLRPAEYQVLIEKAERRMYQAEDVLMKQGEKAAGILIIQKGTVRVMRENMGFQIEIAQHGPGEIFGEMSFIEAEPASTSVVAAETVGALLITHQQVQEIIQQNPGFFGRFFQSLAYILSQRLRATTGMLSGGGDWQSE